MMTSRVAVSIDFGLSRHTPSYRSTSGELPDDTVGTEAYSFLRDVLADHDATATFFVVGEVAEQHPEVIAEVAGGGHEIVFHTYRLILSLNKYFQIEELERSRATIRTAAGQKQRLCTSAFDVSTSLLEKLDKAGYRYNSSVILARQILDWHGSGYYITFSYSDTKFKSNTQYIFESQTIGLICFCFPLSGYWTRLLEQNIHK